jgi:undecaprenyl-diphosphatase
MPGWIFRLGEFDERLLHAVVLRRRAALDILVRMLTRLGDPAVAVVLGVLLALGGAPGIERAGATAAFSLALSHLLVQILKRSFPRRRPSLPVGMLSLIHPPDRFSFPSGHAAAGLSLALPLALTFPTVLGMAVLFLGLTVGLTRCYLGVHYPGDVLAGWSLAALSVALAGPSLGFFLQ